MSHMRFFLLLVLTSMSWFGCGGDKAVIPTTEFSEEQKKAIKAEDEKVAAEESHGKQKK